MLMIASERLIVSSEYDPFSIIETLSSYLAGSANIVVQSPHIQVAAGYFEEASTSLITSRFSQIYRPSCEGILAI